MTRPRLTYAGLLLLTVVLGLASRHFARLLPWWMAKNAGDVLYATMAFWLAGLLLPRLAAWQTGVAALAFCVAIEFAKFLPIPWLVAARHKAWGHLIFGTGFHAANLLCYALGVLLGAGIERALRRPRPSRPITG